MMQADHAWMQIALEEAALAASEGEIPVGVVIVKDGRMLARAHNLREQQHDPTEHAEMRCLKEAATLLHDWRLTGCTLYVTLEPCPMCAGALAMSRISHVVFGARDKEYGCCGSVYDLVADPAFQSNTTWQDGVCAEQASEMLTSFFKNRRK